MKQLVLYLNILIKRLIQIDLNKNKALWIKTGRLKRNNTNKWHCFILKEGASLVTKGFLFKCLP